MKLIIIAVLVVACLTVRAQSNPATTVANTIAQRLKDTLNLSEMQRNQLFEINLQLHHSKATVRQQYATSDSLRFHLQRVENTRDSLYRAVLNEEKYQLYRTKKTTLVSSL